MQVQLKIKRYPFIDVYKGDYVDHPFFFTPTIIEHIYTNDQVNDIAEYMIKNIPEVNSLHKSYLSALRFSPIKYIEFDNFTVKLDENQVRNLVNFLILQGVRVKPYARYLPVLSSDQFNQVRELAKRKGYRKALSLVMGLKA